MGEIWAVARLVLLGCDGSTTEFGQQVFALVQGLEAFHRRTTTESVMDAEEFADLLKQLVQACPERRREWLQQRLNYANEVGLAARIKAIIAPVAARCGRSATRSKLVRKIVDTRNYMTHYDRSLERRAAKGESLLHLCYLLEILFQVHLLKTIGFSEKEIDGIIDNSYRLKQKLALAAQDGQPDAVRR